MSPLIDNSIDALTWFLLKSNASGIACGQKKIYALLYISQGYYSVATNGDKLIPSIFIAKPEGVFEPNLLKACKYFSTPPTIASMSPQAVMFLESIWKKFSETDEKVLINMIKNSEPYIKAIQNAIGYEILFDDMFEFYKKSVKIPTIIPSKQENIAKPAQSVMMKNENGKAVKTKAWQPKRI